ncbi:MAG TPA: carboxypeptidase-like regulatory domain-containing protein [Planctomycetaceae bacterium]|jgi:hypothetical protein|nr:carboxypeptidase-like regulatory domain-containing protein [Planctomycetaceae bacterium]
MRRLPVCLALVLSLGVGHPAADGPALTTIRLRVRAEDASARPIAKARGVLFKTAPQSARAMRMEAPLAITKQGAALVAGSDGVIETPPLALKMAYVLEIDAEGFAPELTRWTHPSQTGTIELPPVKLRRLGAVKGTVVNRQGQPIPNVTAIQAGDGPKRLEVVTDGQGRFALNGVPEGNAVVCFEAAGYRFFGSVLACPTDNARIELERVGDPHPRVPKRVPISPHEWPEERRLATSKKLLEPLVARVLAKKVIGEAEFPILAAAARNDPERILARLDQLKFALPFRRNQIRNMATFALPKRGKPQASLGATAKLGDPESQINAYLYSRRDPANVAARRMDLQKARGLIAASKETLMRGYWLAELGKQFWDIGDHEAAREVFNACRKDLDNMPADTRGREGLRMMLATAVARDSTAEAKKLAGDLEPGPMMRLAGEVAREHPQEAEAFLADVPNNLSLMQLSAVGNNLPPLCYRVARRDPAAAERILIKFARPPQAQSDAESVFGLAGSMFGNFSKELIDFQVTKVKAVCYGLIAEAAAKRDPAAARRALLQSVELLRPMRTGFVHPQSHFYHSPAVLMAMLVPVADRVDPPIANEIFWRALSLRISMTGESYDRVMFDVDVPDLVNIVKFYDEPLAAGLLEPVLSRLISRSYSGMQAYVWGIQSLTLMDPARAIDFPNSLSELPGWDDSSARDSAIQFVANALASAALWDKDLDRRLHHQLGGVRNEYGVYLNLDDDHD